MNRSHRRYPCFLSLLFAFYVNAAYASPALDSNESAIVAWSENHNEEAIDLSIEAEDQPVAILEGIVDLGPGELLEVLVGRKHNP